MLGTEHMDVACGSDEDLTDLGSVETRHDPVALHRRSHCTDRIDLGDDHVCPKALGSRCDPPATVTESSNYHSLACEEDVRCSKDPVKGGLACTVSVVE